MAKAYLSRHEWVPSCTSEGDYIPLQVGYTGVEFIKFRAAKRCVRTKNCDLKLSCSMLVRVRFVMPLERLLPVLDGL